MGMFSGLEISASALTAQRLRTDVIAENIANATNTRTVDGTTYRRRFTVFQERENTTGTTFAQVFENARNKKQNLNPAVNNTSGRGVRVVNIVEDDSPFRLDYNPTHPDANEDGYVEMPNVDTAREMIDFMEASRAYEANVTALNAFKAMAVKAMEIGRN